MTDGERLRELARAVVDASANWSGEDEERNPALGRARTLAGLALRPAKPPGPRPPHGEGQGPLERPRDADLDDVTLRAIGAAARLRAGETEDDRRGRQAGALARRNKAIAEHEPVEADDDQRAKR